MCKKGVFKKFTNDNIGIMLVAIGGLLYSVFLHYILGMDGNFDTANYHAYIGWSALKGLTYQYGALAQYHTYFNPLVDLINYKAFSVSPFLGAAFHSISFTATILVLWRLAELTIENNYYLSFAVAIGVTSAMAVSLFGTWMNEHIVALPIIFGLYLLLKSLDDESLYPLIYSGVFFGIGVGLKLTAAHYLVGAFIVVAILSRFNILKLLALFFGFGLAYILVDGYFMILRWNYFDNPVFPLANNIFKSSYYPYEWKSFSHFEVDKLFYYLGLPVTWLHSGEFSEIQTTRDGRFFLAYIGMSLLSIAYLFGRRVCRKELALVVFFLASWITWILVFRVYRYLVVLELLSGLIFIIGLIRFVGTTRSILKAALISFAIIFLYHVTVYPDWGRRQWSDRFYSSNLTHLLAEEKAELVLLADNRVSYLAPTLYDYGVRFAYLFSQQWWDGNRRGAPMDPGSSDMDLPNKTYFLQYSVIDPRRESFFLRGKYSDSIFHCMPVMTNMPWSPYLCSFKVPAEFPSLKLGIDYKHDSARIMFSEGWSFPEKTHRWSSAKQASIIMKPEMSSCSQILEIAGTALGDQVLGIRVNANKIYDNQVRGDFLLRLELKKIFNSSDGILKVDFNFPHAYSPSKDDPRVLAVALRSLRIDCIGSYRLFNVTNKEWLKGVAKGWGPAFFVKDSAQARQDFSIGSKVVLVDGSERAITSHRVNGDDLIIYLEGEWLDGNLVGYPASVKPLSLSERRL